MLSAWELFNEYFTIPGFILTVFAVVWLIMNVVGEALEFKGKVVPEYMKVRKYFARKKQERETLAAIPGMMDNVNTLLNDVNKHYSNDNICKRNNWIDKVNSRLDSNEAVVKEINRKIDKNSRDIVDLLLDNKRETIISFAEKVSNDSFPATREQFTRIFKIYEEYERIIEERGLTNGEIDVAHKIINESYQVRLKNHTFIEDIRWHGLEQ